MITNLSIFHPITGGTRIGYTYEHQACEHFTWHIVTKDQAYEVVQELSHTTHRDNYLSAVVGFKKEPYSENWNQ